jgi:hypothetical protein
MKGILHKTEQGYYMLFDENKQWIGVTGDCDGKKLKLSKQNCDEIFGVFNVDVDDLAYKHRRVYQDSFEGMNECIMKDAMHQQVGFVAGFNKAMELNKDKLFTVENIKKAILWAHDKSTEGVYLSRLPVDEFIKSLQQPTEIEVDIEMDICGDKVYAVPEPKLDENGCIVLRKL